MREHVIKGTRLRLVQGDITEQAVDAIVNAANTTLSGGSGVDGAIHAKGGPTIQEECAKIRAEQGGCPTGHAVATTAGELPARWVIHTVGPVWRGGNHGEFVALEHAYGRSLVLAQELGARTVAFPSISTGAYGFPVDRAAQVALVTIARHLTEGGGGGVLEEVRLVLFSGSDLAVYEGELVELVRTKLGTPGSGTHDS